MAQSKKMTDLKISIKYEKNKPTNNKKGGKRRNRGHRHRKYFFNKITDEKSPILKKEVSIMVQEASRTPNRLHQKRKYQCHILTKALNLQNKERILNIIK